MLEAVRSGLQLLRATSPDLRKAYHARCVGQAKTSSPLDE
jgi:hypothetical protein